MRHRGADPGPPMTDNRLILAEGIRDSLGASRSSPGKMPPQSRAAVGNSHARRAVHRCPAGDHTASCASRFTANAPHFEQTGRKHWRTPEDGAPRHPSTRRLTGNSCRTRAPSPGLARPRRPSRASKASARRGCKACPPGGFAPRQPSVDSIARAFADRVHPGGPGKRSSQQVASFGCRPTTLDNEWRNAR